MRFLLLGLALFGALFVTPAQAADDDDTWQQTLDRVVPAVVAIRVTGTRDFDTENARSSVGTGFVVDAERGLILTNRHMVHAGPVIAEAVFEKGEEVPLQAVYRDPVHDFGVYRYDPAQVRHTAKAQLTLVPDAAVLGLDVRVVGNDSGEKISILDGTLARIDRNAPRYGGNTYNDFNTFYLQAASNTSGGSSGSPVVDLAGRVVGLNAGGKTRAASSFYLPLNRVVRALDLIQRGEPVARGTLQTVFSFTYFDELSRLGLKSETEEALRAAREDATGMLVVVEVVPGGPAEDKLLPGDVLVKVNGELVDHFVPLEAALDSAVGESVALVVQRGGRELSFELTVDDLHSISPDTYLEVGRAIVHTVSYQQARNHKVPARGVYVAVGGYMLQTAAIPEGSIITQVNGEDTPDLDTFQEVLEGIAGGQRIRVRFHAIAEPRHSFEHVVVMDRRWFTMQRCTRDDSNGLWPCKVSPPPPEPTRSAAPDSLVLPEVDKPASAVASSLVVVDFDVPYPTGGVKDLNYIGVGTIVDAQKGLVLVDRDTVPVTLGDLMLTFAGAVRVPATVVYLHAAHNYALLRYDPSELGNVPVEAVTFAKKPAEEGSKVWQIGLNRNGGLVSLKTRIGAYEHVHMGASGTPRFRDHNIMLFDTEDAEPSLGGVLTDRKGRVVALWASFLDQREEERRFYGLPVDWMRPIIDQAKAGQAPTYRHLGVEVAPVPLARARDRGLSDARIRQILEDDPSRRILWEVTRVDGRAPAHAHLESADILLTLNGELVGDMTPIEALHDQPSAEMTLLRGGSEVTVSFETQSLDGAGVDRVVSWAGMLLHDPHYEVSAQQSIDPEGPYVAWMWYGSPAARYGLRPTRRVVQVNETPTPDLDAFMKTVDGLKDQQPVRLTMESLDGSRRVETLKMDLMYWPTQVFEATDGEWSRRDLESAE